MAREELIENAVVFLKDPQVLGASHEKKLEFLESKGLSQDEVDEALKRSQDPNYASNPSSEPVPQVPATHPVAQSYQYYTAPPPVPEKDWKDYFIMATATVGVTYALYEITKRFLIPNILPDSKSQLEKDKEAIEQEFLRIEASLNDIAETQKQLKESEDEKTKVIDATIGSVQELILESKDKNTKVQDDIKYLKSEIENLKTSFDRSLEKQQNSISAEVAGLQHELHSLQQLVKSKNTLTGEMKGNVLKTSPIPAASSIPSASEILKRANMARVPSPTTSTGSTSPQVMTPPQAAAHTPAAQIPAWQRAASLESTTPAIPAWQKSANDATPGAFKQELESTSASYSPRESVDIPQEQKFTQ